MSLTIDLKWVRLMIDYMYLKRYRWCMSLRGWDGYVISKHSGGDRGRGGIQGQVHLFCSVLVRSRFHLRLDTLDMVSIVNS